MTSRTVIATDLHVAVASWSTFGVSLDGADVVVVPTAAAFVGAEAAVLSVHQLLDERGASVEGLMMTDRAATTEPYFVRRLGEADIVLVLDGAPLHARTVWRSTPVGEALVAAPTLVALGETASVLGAVMIDPRGGAPTTGLGRFDDLVVGMHGDGSRDQRTVSLLGTSLTAMLYPGAVVMRDDQGWRVLAGEVDVTRGGETAAL